MKTWKTKNGEKIKIKDMSTYHIENCLNMLKKYQQNILCDKYFLLGMLHGEQATLQLEKEINSIEEYGVKDISQEYIVEFENELSRRIKQ